MVVAAAVGVAGGFAAGLAYGFNLYSKSDPVNSPLTSTYDELRSAPPPDPEDADAVKKNAALQSAVTPYLPAWVKGSDFERVDWLNKTLRNLFPHYNKAICKIVVDSVTPILEGLMPSFVDEVKFDEFDFGEIPFTLGGIRLYNTDLDEVSFDAQMNWGGEARVVLGIYAKGLHFQVEVSDIQVKGLCRVTLGPLVDIIPCLGGVSISFIEDPVTDLCVRVLGGPDLLAIPGVDAAVNMALKQFVYGKMGEPNFGLVYPNMMSFDILADGGREKPIKGLLKVKLHGAEGLMNNSTVGTSDPFVLLQVVGGSSSKFGVKSSTCDNNLSPSYEENFDLLVFDTDLDKLEVILYDEDMLKLGNDEEMGRVAIDLDEESLAPFKPKDAWFSLLAPKDEDKDFLNKVNPLNFGKKGLGAVVGLVSKKKLQDDPFGKVHLTLEYRPFEDGKKILVGRASETGNLGTPAKGEDSVLGAPQRAPDQQPLGVLRVKLVCATSLMAKGLDGVSDPYVTLVTEGKRRKSTVKADESSPYWNESFEFVAVKDTSFLHISIFSMPGQLDKLKGGIMNLKTTLTKGEIKHDLLGDLVVPISYVAKNRRVKERFPLHHTKSGDVTLALTWTYFR